MAVTPYTDTDSSCSIARSSVILPTLTETAYLRYDMAIWAGAPSRALERVLIQQERAIRCLAGVKYQTVFTELKIFTLVSLYIQEAILHKICVTSCKHQDIHNYNTRNTSNVALPAHHLSLYSKKPSNSGAMLFNLQPKEIKNTDPRQLKKRPSIWLQDRPFYTLDEYLQKEEETTQRPTKHKH